MQLKTLLLIFFIGLTVDTCAQIPNVTINEPGLEEILEQFADDLNSVYDSLMIDKSKGVILIEFTNVNIQSFPLGYVSHFDSLHTCINRNLIGYEVRMSISFDEQLCSRFYPTFFSKFRGKPVLIYGGFERFVRPMVLWNKHQWKEVKRRCDEHYKNVFITWLIDVDLYNGGKIYIKSKVSGI